MISSIVHIAHEYDDDNEPWPIEIEDHDGNLHAVNLQMGEVSYVLYLKCFAGVALVKCVIIDLFLSLCMVLQMLFYESAKCLHGRRSPLKGKYYGSIFVHYQPVDRSIWNYSIEVTFLFFFAFFSLSSVKYFYALGLGAFFCLLQSISLFAAMNQ